MTDYILSSNLTSSLYRGLKPNQEDITYDMPKSVIGAVKTIDKVTANSVPAGNVQTLQSEVIFNLPQGGWLDNMLLENKITFASSDAAVINKQIGKTLIAEVQFCSNTKVLYSCTSSALIAQIADAEPSKAMLYNRVSGSLDPNTYEPLTAAASVVTTYTPITLPYSESIRLSLDTGFNEPLTLKIKYASKAAAGNTIDVTGVVPVLWLYKHFLDLDTQIKMRASYDKTSGIDNRLLLNTYTQTFQCSNATVNEVKLSCNFPVSKMHFFLKTKSTTFDAETSEVVMPVIKSFQFLVSGRDVYSSGKIPSIVNQYESALMSGRLNYSTGSAAGITMDGLNKIVTLDFGLLKNNRYSCSGLVCFTNLNNPTIVVETGTITPTDYEVHVVYEFFNMITTTSRGITSQTIAS